MSVRLNPKALEAARETAKQILGIEHPLVAKIGAISHDPDLAREVWQDIEALPEEARRALAAMVADMVMPGLKPDSDTQH